MIVECNILNWDTIAEKYGGEGEKIWGSFVFNSDELLGFSEFMENNEVESSCTETMFKSGKNYIIDIPFVDFKKAMLSPIGSFTKTKQL